MTLKAPKAFYPHAAFAALLLFHPGAHAQNAENGNGKDTVDIKSSPAEDTTFVVDTDYDLVLAPADFDLPGQVKSFPELYKLTADEKTTKVSSWNGNTAPSNMEQYNTVPFGFAGTCGYYRIPGTEGPNSLDNTRWRGVDFKISYRDLRAATVGLHLVVNDTRASEQAADNIFKVDLAIPKSGFQLVKLGPPLKGQQVWLALQPNKIVASVPPENVTPVKLLPGNKIELKFTAADGSEVDTTKMRGKVIVVDYWATWCGPCIEALPRLEELYKKYHDRGFEIIGINLDDNRAIMDRFLRANKHPWPQSVSAAAGKNVLADAFNLQGIPAFLLIDKDGVYTKMDVRTAGTDAQIEALLNK